MKPGMSARPSRSTIVVDPDLRPMIAPAAPTAAILPFLIARASTVRVSPAIEMIGPPRKMRSAPSEPAAKADRLLARGRAPAAAAKNCRRETRGRMSPIEPKTFPTQARHIVSLRNEWKASVTDAGREGRRRSKPFPIPRVLGRLVRTGLGRHYVGSVNRCRALGRNRPNCPRLTLE